MKHLKKISACILLLALMSSCVNLKHVHDFSSSSLKSINEFEEINYGFEQICIDNCKNKDIKRLLLDDTSHCDCANEIKADEVTMLIYNVVVGYFDGLSKLSAEDLTNYKTDGLAKALGDAGAETEKVNAAAEISRITLKAVAGKYRSKKIKNYINEANSSIIVLIKALDFNVSNITGKLKLQQQSLKADYFSLIKDASLSGFEKRKVIEEYHSRLKEISLKIKKYETYSKSLKKVTEAHQKIKDNIDKFSAEEMKAMLNSYASDIKILTSEFNKLKN
ncbi:hypothetical protein HYN59_16015 [Flavobacterium album]|uniref:Lipoprotein n=1 Tax=Flavobacterium album TaxID=2175091 RepID=A0A2S1R1G9_9FLAO|nr:hypothetical protein [Flavobacterium album]AWH86520.1 hypothetical protein HYN59_16015 [Flavobacterium album]